MATNKIPDKLLDVAQRVFDQYFQDFVSADEFFSIEDFSYWISVIYAKEADDTAQMIYKNSLAELGGGYLTFSQDWWKSKEYIITNKQVVLDVRYMGFTYDNQNSGIQLIVATDGNCGNIIRTTITQSWILSHVTQSSNIWWYVDDNKIVFKYSGNAAPKKIKVFYIPTAEDENFDLPKSREFIIANTAFQFLTQAKQGIVIDDTNNQNRNRTVQTEVDQKTLQPING